MGRRRAGRELALRTLFQVDLARADPAEALAAAAAEGEYEEESVAFARELALGACRHLARLDEVIARHARGWTLERMANVDRNLLRLAVYEILYRPEIPPSVSVDEAVEMAKKYSTAESGRFINGILGNLIRSLEEGREEASRAGQRGSSQEADAR